MVQKFVPHSTSICNLNFLKKCSKKLHWPTESTSAGFVDRTLHAHWNILWLRISNQLSRCKSIAKVLISSPVLQALDHAFSYGLAFTPGCSLDLFSNTNTNLHFITQDTVLVNMLGFVVLCSFIGVRFSRCPTYTWPWKISGRLVSIFVLK